MRINNNFQHFPKMDLLCTNSLADASLNKYLK